MNNVTPIGTSDTMGASILINKIFNIKNSFIVAAVMAVFVLTGCQSNLYFKDHEGKVSLYENDQLVYSYQVDTKSHNGTYARANYIHPLNDFEGNPLTEDFPEDHLHQRGIFWSWHQVFIDTVSMADPWVCQDIEWQVEDVEHWTVGKSAGFSADVTWLVGSQKTEVIKEKVAVVCQISPDYYYLDFDISLTSLQDALSIGGSNDNKGYGGFSARLMMGEDVAFYDSKGEVTPDNEPVQAGDWILMDDIGVNSSNVVIMYHPRSSASLQGWILRKTGSMQNPVWPGRERVTMNEGNAVDFKARVVVFKGETDVELIEELYAKFSAE